MKTFKKLFAFSAIFALLATMMPMYAKADANYSDELVEAYAYAYSKGITTMDSIDKADMYGNLTRIAMAKMVSNYVLDLELQELDTSKDCNFPDVSTALDKQYDNGVTKACQLGLMGVGIDKFNPNGIVTRAEFGTVLSRALWGEENNDGNPYYEKHLKALKAEGIMTQIDNPNMTEVRGYVMIMMQRADAEYSGLGECTVEEMVACLGEAMAGGDMAACIAACSGIDKPQEPSEKAGDLTLSITDYSNKNPIIPADGTSIFNTMKFTASESITVNSITLEKGSLSQNSIIKGVWFEKDGVAVSSKGTIGSDGKLTTNFIRGFNVKANETLDLVVELKGGAGAFVSFQVIGVDSSAKNAKYDNVITTEYQTASYTVTELAFEKTGGAGKVTYKLGNQPDYVIGNFRIKNNGASYDGKKDDRDVVVKSITFRNNGTADLSTMLKNVKLIRDNKEVSKSVVFNGRNVTFVLEDTIAAGKTAIYSIKTEIALLDRVKDTVQLELRKNTDLVAYESTMKVRTQNKGEGVELQEYEFEGGRVVFVNTQGFPKVVDAGSGASDVVIADGKLTIVEPIKLPKMELYANNKGIKSLVLEIGNGSHTATISETGTKFTFDDVYVNTTSPVKLIASLESDITASSIKFTGNINANAFDGNGEYLNNQENLKSEEIAGAIQIAKINVKEPAFTLKNNATTTQRSVIGDVDTKVIFSGTMSAKSDITVNEMTLECSEPTIGNDFIDLVLYVNDNYVSNISYKSGTGSFNNVGTVGKDPVSVVIKATPTVNNVGNFTFDVQAKGTDANGNSATSSKAKTVKLKITENASISITNATTTSSVALEGANTLLTTFNLVVKDGAVNVTGLDLTFNDTKLDNKDLTLEIGDGTYDVRVSGNSAVFGDPEELNTNLLPGTYEAKIFADINVDNETGSSIDYDGGIKTKLNTVKVYYDGTSKSANLGANYLFVKGFPVIERESAENNDLIVKITNNNEHSVKIAGFTGTNIALASLKGQAVTPSIDESKQVTLKKGESTELVLSVETGTLMLKGLSYTVEDRVENRDETYYYSITDEYTNVAKWGTFKVTFK